MPSNAMVSINSWFFKNRVDASSVSMKWECRQFEERFVTDFTGNYQTYQNNGISVSAYFNEENIR